MSFTVGVDLGQARDFTAFAVVDETPEKIPKKVYEVRHLERHRNKSYPDLVDRLKTIVSRLPGQIAPLIAVDATGVGRPVVDMIEEANLRGDIYAVTITGGDATTLEKRDCRVPKRDLVSTVAVLLQTDRLRIARDLKEAPILERELRAFRAKISVSGNDSYEAWRERDHDDLVLAVSLAVWLREKGEDPWSRWFREPQPRVIYKRILIRHRHLARPARASKK